MEEAKQSVVAVCGRLYDKGFVAANDGNVSILQAEGTILITPAGVSKGTIAEGMLCLVDFSGQVLDGALQPSSETFMHVACYKMRNNIGAVVHAHPPFATALAATDKANTINKDLVLPETLMTTGRIGVVAYHTPGSSKLATSVAESISEHNGILLRNHGVLTVGTNLEEAYYRLESIEMYCKIKVLAELLGGVNYLSKDEVSNILS